jgi:hypothetical protein
MVSLGDEPAKSSIFEYFKTKEKGKRGVSDGGVIGTS